VSELFQIEGKKIGAEKTELNGIVNILPEISGIFGFDPLKTDRVADHLFILL